MYRIFFFCLLLLSCNSKKLESKEQISDSLDATAAAESTNTVAEKTPEDDYVDVKPTHVYFLGFSPDLEYAAFDVIEEGFLDVAGARYFLNVDKNDFAAKSIKIDGGQEADLDQVKELLNEAGMPTVQKLDINGNNLGKLIELDSAKSDNRILINKEPYTLRLMVGDAPNGGKMFELHLLHGAGIQVLQKDKKRPESRTSAIHYYMKQAWVNGSKIAVLIMYDSEPYVVEAATFKYRRALLVTGNISF